MYEYFLRKNFLILLKMRENFHLFKNQRAFTFLDPKAFHLVKIFMIYILSIISVKNFY